MTYYGKTPAGKKLHMGTKVIPYIGDTRSFQVQTFCGAQMVSDDTDLRPDLRLEFCRNCFRAMAWQLLMDHMEKQASSWTPESRIRASQAWL